MHEITGKTCLECGATFRGRIDKKFCSDQCRSTFNNRRNASQSEYIRNVNYVLRKNRRILLELNPHGKNKVRRDKLQLKGFDFSLFTSVCPTREGNHYYCYDQGYIAIEHDQFLLTSRSEADHGVS